MRIPAVTYGPLKDASRNCRRSLSELKKGQSWEQATEQLGFFDTQEIPGMIQLHGPNPLVRNDSHFHVYLLHSIVRNEYLEKKISKELENLVFENSLRLPWATLGLMAEPSLGFLYPASRHRPFIRAVLNFWDIYKSENARFSDGGDYGMELWQAQGNLQYALVHIGVEENAIRAFHPTGSLRNLLSDAGFDP